MAKKTKVLTSQVVPLQKAPTGIRGLDEITGGGLAQREDDHRLRRAGLRKDDGGP